MLNDKTISEESFFANIRGFSMQPFIKDGDKVIVKKIKAQDLKVGNIILYKDGNGRQTICHRLVRKIESENGIMLFTRGDAQIGSTGPILENNLLGCVVGIIRDNKIMNLRTRQQSMLNWLNAKFYIIFRIIFISLCKLRKSR